MEILKFEDYCVREEILTIESDPLDFYNSWKINEGKYRKYCERNGFKTENYSETAVFIF